MLIELFKGCHDFLGKREEFIELLKDEEKVKKNISEEEVKEIFDLKFHTRNIDKIYKKVLK